jgi:hypothetical protein
MHQPLELNMTPFVNQFRLISFGHEAYGWLARSRKGAFAALDHLDIQALWPEYLEVLASSRVGKRGVFPRLILPIESLTEDLLQALRAMPQLVRNRTTLVVEFGDVNKQLHAARREILVKLGFGLGLHLRSGADAPASIGAAVLLGAHLLLVNPSAVTPEQHEELRSALGNWMQIVSVEVEQEELAQPATGRLADKLTSTATNSAWGALA